MRQRNRNPAGWIASVALAIALAGCVAQPPPPTVEKPKAAAPAEPKAATPAETETAAAPATMPKEEPEPEIDIPTPEELLGMNRAEIVKILGQPDFRRHDVPALLMRYRDERCILDLFLYPPKGRRGADIEQVEHVEARSNRGDRVSTGVCIESVMKSRTARAPG